MKIFLLHQQKGVLLGMFLLVHALLIFQTQSVYSQTGTGRISGKVTDETGAPLPGTSVKIEGTTNGAQTGADGTYSLTAQPGTYTLIATFISYQQKRITGIVVSSGQTAINNITLLPESGVLNEVVVVGYGTQKKENLTGSVDQVSGKTLQNRPIPNLSQGLQGVLPNLNIRLGDGKPNQAPSFNVRGATSIGQGGNALVLIDGVEGDPSLLNPNDVESVTVLKDAASSSIYGARAVFGVVMIMTKKALGGRTSVNYSNNYASKSPVERPDFVTDGYTWARMFTEAFLNGDGSFPQNANKTQKWSPAYLAEFKKRAESGQPYNTVEVDPVTKEYVYYGSTDFYKELYNDHNGANEHNLSITGATDKLNFLVSGRYQKQGGLFRYNSDDYDAKNFRARGSIQVFPWLKIDNNADFSVVSYFNPLNVGEGGGIWRNIADEGHPTSVMFNPDGTLAFSAVYTVGDFWYGKNGIDSKKQLFRNTTGFTTSFFGNKFRVNGDFTFRNNDFNREQKRVQVPYSAIQGITSYVGTTTNDLAYDNRNTEYIANNLYAEYENKFRDAHSFKIMAGYNFEQSTYNRLAAQRNGIIYDGASDLNLALGQQIVTGGGYDRWAILGGFSRLNYAFKDRYLLEVNGRYDGSSKFPSDQRFGFFPSLSAGWRVSQEPFWKVSPKFISDLKIRASYGSLGNGNIDSYVFQENFGISQSGIILNGTRPQQTSRPSVLPNGLTWETSTTSNLGLDMALLSDRLTFSGDAYIRNTTDMFTVGLTAPAVFGATVPKGNYADLRTKGWELSMAWQDRIKGMSKPLGYNIRLSLADNTTKILKYNNPDKLLNDYYEGQTVGEIWGYETEGFFIDQKDIDSHAKQGPQMRASPTNLWYPGDIKLKDLNNDGFINVGTDRVSNPGDRKIIGNRSPRYTYGINLGADWNNLYFTSFFQGVGKQDWYPSTEAEFFWGQYNRPYNNIPNFHLGNMWTPENTNAYFPRTMSRAASNATNRTLGVAQTRYLQNVAYIRMKNIQVGYNLPQKWISKVKATSARVYFSGENLWTYSPLYKIASGIDVENTVASDQVFNPGGNSGDGYNYPMLKSISLGLNLSY
ncbi:SusC/RagA family TonB-linked outer membrane protein [Daejeonella lutea]|uniref:TonB-linked outer membrane protein, SusC/RagA family n=1 Tax=Daejeonella lutea TaxID=572036 RepID=A0A1T5EWT2_9SPHI|nr:TonB-dependent receptor [Daejeonella lutea]SKB88405.1 TonB-linked outer membrane protein, SusC/RagA family [Daejeonella lutea]